ncbi:MAG: proteasome assembly chaperone family protein [Candidatus Helarchaeota archaeon]
MDSQIFISEYETKEIENLIIGFPDVGLVGLISGMHVIDTLKMEELGHLDSSLFPPLVVLHGGKIKSPARIYYKDKTAFLISEIPIPPDAILPVAETIVHWVQDRKIKQVFVLYGIPIPNRLNIEKPTVFANAIIEETSEALKSKDIKFIDTGVLAGAHASILWEAKKVEPRVNIIALGVESFLKYPDPAAAASLIETMNQLTGLNVDVKELLEKAEELRLKLRDTMARTQEMMQRQMEQGGMQQTDLPAMFG